MRPWKGGGVPVSHIPLIILKISHITKYIWKISPNFRKHCIPISLNMNQLSRIPLNIYKNILYPFKFLANIPVSLKILPGPHVSTQQVSSRRVYPQGGTLIFTAYVGSGPASTVHPPKISLISSTPKKYLKFWQPRFCTLTLRKKVHRNDH